MAQINFNQISNSFDVTDGPSGVKYIILNEFLSKYFKTGRNSDFSYMNFPNDKSTVREVIALVEKYARENDLQYFTFCKSVCAINDDVFINSGYGDEESTTVFQVEVVGDRSKFEHLFSYLREKELKFAEKEATINWFYTTPNGITNRSIRFDSNPHSVKDEYYPYIKKGVNNFMKDFLESDCSVLILMGDPGTGKTSLVRDFAFKNKLKTFMTFDEHIISSDDFFVNFMTDKEAQLLVIEDADVLISSRDKERNKIMAKFLNISDGLVSHQNKKIIFTTNLSNIDSIDPALIRPGRCYGVLNFRQLTKEEANGLRKSLKMPPLVLNKSKYTLAEIFNDSQSNIHQVKKKVGII